MTTQEIREMLRKIIGSRWIEDAMRGHCASMPREEVNKRIDALLASFDVTPKPERKEG